MSQDRRESRISVRETANKTGAVSSLPVRLFNGIVGANTSPEFLEKSYEGMFLLCRLRLSWLPLSASWSAVLLSLIRLSYGQTSCFLERGVLDISFDFKRGVAVKKLQFTLVFGL